MADVQRWRLWCTLRLTRHVCPYATIKSVPYKTRSKLCWWVTVLVVALVTVFLIAFWFVQLSGGEPKFVWPQGCPAVKCYLQGKLCLRGLPRMMVWCCFLYARPVV